MTDDEYSPESGRRASAEPIINKIKSVKEQLRVRVDADQRSMDWDNPDHRRTVREEFEGDSTRQEAVLPGFGPDGEAGNARDDCGDKHPFVCNMCGHSVDFGRTCGQSICGRCAIAWCRDLAINKSAKVRRLRKEKHQHTPDREHQKIHHQIISPSLRWYFELAKAGYSLEEAQEETKKVVKFILDEMRAQGVLVRHSYRGARDDGEIKEEQDDMNLWKERIFSQRNWDDDVREQLAWKPHYHAIVVGDWLEGGEMTKRIERETGWVIHRITGEDKIHRLEDEAGNVYKLQGDDVSIPSDGAMARVLTYCLSHCDIRVRENDANRSAVWEIGSFEGDIIKSSGRFSATPADLDWADGVVRRHASRVLGLRSGTTDCGASIPAVDDPDELAHSIIEELYPDDPERQRDVHPEAVLHHVSEGNIRVDVSSTSGGGGSITVTDAWGQPIGPGGWGGDLPDAPSPVASDGGAEAIDPIDVDDDCGCGHDHDDVDLDDQDDVDDDRDDVDDAGGGTEECDGTLIPLEEARQRGLLEDEDWLQEAANAVEAIKAHQEWPEDLDPWLSSSPGASIGT